jgi:hypothetical protein
VDLVRVFLALAAAFRHGATPWTPWLAGLGVTGAVLGAVVPRAMKPAFIGLTLLISDRPRGELAGPDAALVWSVHAHRPGVPADGP